MSAELNQQKQELEPTSAAKQDASRSLFLNPESLNPKTYIPVIPKAKAESEADYRNRENVRNTVYGRTLIQGEFSLPYDADLDENLFAGDSQEEVRAQNQGFLGETGRGAVKFTNEVVLGTASAVGRLVDFPSYVEMWDSENKDYTNLFSAAVDAVKEDINEKYGKVYVASENKGFSPFSWESWMDNAGNLGTAISLMLPSMGLIKGLSAAAKGVGAVRALRAAAVMGEATTVGAGAAELGMFANAAKKIGQFATSSVGKATLKGITGASFSRYVEGGMEAEGAQKEYRNSMIEYYDQNGNPIYKVKDKVTGARFTAEEVEVAAGKVAASTFKNNAWLAAIDLFQYRTAFKGMDMARRNAEAIASSTVKKNMFKQAGKFVAEQGLSEGAEEGAQYIAKEEAKYDQLLANKLVDESTFTDRLLQYVDEDEFKTSVLHGAVGGILFGGGMKAMNYKDSKKQKQYLQGLVDSYKAQDAALTGNAAAFNAAQRNVIINNAAQKAKDGTLSVLEADLNTLSLATDEELKSQGVDVADYRDKIAKSKELVATVASEYNKAVNNPNLGEKYAASYAAARAHQKSLDFQEIAESKEIEKLKNEDLEVFKSRDASVANLMVAAKEARRVGDKEKYDKKIKDILEESSVYKTAKEVEEALATSQDTKYHEIAKSTARRKADKEELKILIDDMFTEEGKQKIDKAVEQNVVKDVVKEGIETSLGNTANPEELSVITNAAQATANAKIEELKNNGEYSENKAAAIIAETIKEFSGVTQPEETAETENRVSQTIGDKTHTFDVGDIIQIGTSKRFKVSGIVDGRIQLTKEDGSALPSPDLQYTMGMVQSSDIKVVGKTAPATEATTPTPKENKTTKELEPLAVEKDLLSAAQEKARVDLSPSELMTVSVEFSNEGWKSSGDRDAKGEQVFRFARGTEENPLEMIKEYNPDAGVDFELASSPMTPGKPIDVELRSITTTDNKGTEFPGTIAVFQDGKYIANLYEASKKKLLATIPGGKLEEGQVVKAQIVKKLTTASGNLANVVGLRSSLLMFQDRSTSKAFLPEGKVFVGSVKDLGESVTFYSLDGKNNTTYSKDECKDLTPGVSYMLLKNPNGEVTFVRLNAGTLATAMMFGQNKTVQQHVWESLNSSVDIKDIEDNIKATLADRFGTAIPTNDQVKTVLQETVGGEPSYIKQLQDIIHEKTKGLVITTKAPKEGEKIDPNLFSLQYFYSKTTGKIELQGNVAKTVNKTTDSVVLKGEELKKALGERYVAVDKNMTTSENGAEYLHNVAESGWLTTDVYHVRPWVNVKHIIKFDNEAGRNVVPVVGTPTGEQKLNIATVGVRPSIRQTVQKLGISLVPGSTLDRLISAQELVVRDAFGSAIKTEDNKFYLLPVEQKDGTYKNEEFSRVSNVIQTDKEKAFSEKSGDLYAYARIGGNTIDTIARDFFSQTLMPSQENYNISEEAYSKIIQKLTQLKDYLTKYNVKVIPNNIVIWDSVNKIAGEVDLLLYHPDGAISILDIKTSKSFVGYDTKYSGVSKRDTHSKQVSMYRTILERQLGAKVKGLYVFPITTKTNTSTGTVEDIKATDAKVFNPDGTLISLEYDGSTQDYFPLNEIPTVDKPIQQTEATEEQEQTDTSIGMEDDFSDDVQYQKVTVNNTNATKDVKGKEVEFDVELAKKLQDKLQDLYPEIKLTITNNPVWANSSNIFNQTSDINAEVNYRLKAADILMSDKAKQVFEKGKKNNWSLDKILTELAIPKEQKILFEEVWLNVLNKGRVGIPTQSELLDEAILDFISKYSYTVEINTAKTNEEKQVIQRGDNEEFTFNGFIYEYKDGEYLKDNEIIDLIEYESAKHESFTQPNTQHYSNLTVPGGTNYTENEISTLLITPSIKGHAQFSTDKGIGWFRSDEQVIGGEVYQQEEDDYGPAILQTYNGKPTKTRRILEVQSDLFQKGRDKDILSNNIINNLDFKGKYGKVYKHKVTGDLIDEGDINYNSNIVYNLEDYNLISDKTNKYSNQFLQLLNKDSNWVTFFIKSIVQDSAKKGYEKVLFPKGETAAKIEGHETIADEIRKIDKEIKNNKEFLENPINLYEVTPFDDNYTDAILEDDLDNKVKKAEKNIIKLEKQKQELKSQGVEKLKPIEAFYEIKVGNILEKQFGKDNVKTITDEHGNGWREITINQARDLSDILLQRDIAERIIGQANIKAGTVLIDAINQKQDTLPHEYAHHYIAWFRNTPIVQEGIKRFGSEEALVQAIGEQAVKQKGEAYSWWKRFSKWILSLLSDEQILGTLTDAFLTRENLNAREELSYGDPEFRSMLSEALNDIKSMGDTLTEKQKDVIITHLNDGSLKINC